MNNIREIIILKNIYDENGRLTGIITDDGRLIEVIYVGEKRNDRTDKDRVGDAN